MSKLPLLPVYIAYASMEYFFAPSCPVRSIDKLATLTSLDDMAHYKLE
ncbi:MAG: hypothetical protein AB8B97_17280 [Granulosicoccus sp.]